MIVALLDDQSSALASVSQALPEEMASAEVLFFPTSTAFFSEKRPIDIVLLDFFLTPEGITGADIFSRVRERARWIIGFSSSEKANATLHQCGANFVVQKNRDNSHVERLFSVFLEIILRERADSLALLRTEIDVVDRSLVEMLSRRFFLSKKIAHEKKKQQQGLLDRSREEAVFAHIRALAKEYHWSPEIAVRIFQYIVHESRRAQEVIFQNPENEI